MIKDLYSLEYLPVPDEKQTERHMQTSLRCAWSQWYDGLIRLHAHTMEKLSQGLADFVQVRQREQRSNGCP